MMKLRPSFLVLLTVLVTTFPAFTDLIAAELPTGSSALTNKHSESGLSTTDSVQNADDQFQLGKAYFNGAGVSQSFEKSGFWYRKSAEQGNTKAMHNLGVLFILGQGVEKNEAEGARWIKLAASKNDPKSCYLYATLLAHGTGVGKDTIEAQKWIKKAADLDDPSALARLGECYLYGDEGYPKDPKLALPLLQQAAEHKNPWACGALARMYEKGQVVEKNLKNAQLWYEKGALLGDSESQFNHARFLMLTKGAAKAYPWAKLASDAGCPSSHGFLLECQNALNIPELAEGDMEATKIQKAYRDNSKSYIPASSHSQN